MEGQPGQDVVSVAAAAGSDRWKQSATQLGAHGLSDNIVQAYTARGIKSLYDWQAECLGTAGVAEGKNLVYCAPTSGGKTLVSEVLMLRRVVELRKRAIFVLPYVSIVSEKMQYLRELVRHSKVSVKGFYGGSADGLRETFDIAVCTIEKANALVNRMIEEGSLVETLGTLVVDELHLVGDGSRGYLLEVMLSKVLFLATGCQIVGLSATLPNVEEVARWLHAVLYQTGYRPVPLQEYVLVKRRLHAPDGAEIRGLADEALTDEARAADSSGLVAATWEVTSGGHSALVFCSSKVKCERVAELLAEWLPEAPGEAGQRAARTALLDEMRRQANGLDGTLAKTLPRGVAYHHSGLTTEERSMIERSYTAGALSVICATSTLAAGVNLPARRVIFHSPYMGNAFLDATQYRQMAGRAGRAGQGTIGESVLIVTPKQWQPALELVAQTLPSVKSCLRLEQRGLKRLLLEVLTVTPLGTGEDLIRFCECTLLSTQKAAEGRGLTGDPMTDHPEIAGAIKWLLSHDMLRLDERVQSYGTTPLGRAVCASGLEPQQGYLLWQELDHARPCISLNTDLHICYLITPPESSSNIDWQIFSAVLRHLSSAERKVADRVGVRLDLVDQAAFQGKLPNSVLASLDGVRLVRFYSSLVLWAVLHETPVTVLLQRFALARGNLQTLQQQAAAFTSTVAIFCNKLQWYSMEALIISFQQRLTFGVRQELVPLMQIPSMDCVVARALYEHGFTTPVSIASARPVELLRVLRKTLPHNTPSAALPESNAQRLIDVAKSVAKDLVKEKQKVARDARKRLREGVERAPPATVPVSKRPRSVVQTADRSSHLPVAAPAVQRAPPLDLQLAQAPAGHAASSLPVRRPILAAAHSTLSTSATAARRSPLAAQELQLPRSAAGAPPPPTRRPPPGGRPPRTPPLEQARLGAQASSGHCDAGSRVLTAEALEEHTLAACATPCRGAHGSPSPPATAIDSASPLSSARSQLSEGLRRLGRRSLTPRDVEVCSPGAAGAHGAGRDSSTAPHSASATAACRGGSAHSEPAASASEPSPSQPFPVHRVSQAAEAAFLASAFAQNGRGAERAFSLPTLSVLSASVPTSLEWLRTHLEECSYLGATLVTASDGSQAVCITFSLTEVICVQLPPVVDCNAHVCQQPLAGVLAMLQHWFGDPQHICISSEAKELVGALLRRGLDPSCTFAEPRIAQWLLDPDDKQEVTSASLASSLGIRLSLAASGTTLGGAGVDAMSMALRARCIACWPSAFVVLPIMADLLWRLEAQLLTDSFWQIEMPIATVLAWMEHFGIGVDPRDPQHTYSHVVYKMSALQERVREIVGRPVLLSSGEDVGRALFEDLGVALPRGVRFKRKNNGRIAYRSSVELLKRLPPHPVVSHVLEHRSLAHVARRMETLSTAGEAARVEPQCIECRQNGVPGRHEMCQAPKQRPLLRLRAELIQTGTATGRLVTGTGSVPLLQIENPFSVHLVWRPSLHEELASGKVPEAGARIFAAVAASAPPQAQRLREGLLRSVELTSCAEPFPGGSESLASYWLAHRWNEYADQSYTQSVRQVHVQHGPSGIISYPADKVWRLAAPVRVTDDTPKLPINVRSLLVADAGYVLLSVDYSQLEIRLMAHFSQDARFMQILQSDGDVFRHVAAGWLNKPEASVTAEERSGAKRICYGLIYGLGASKLAAELGISRGHAQELQADFMRQFAGIKAWINSCRDQARQRGYVETLRGRRRFLPALAAGERNERSHAERQAVNTACQASAADLVKTAMLGVHNRLRQLRSHKGDGECRLAGRLLLQIHDELLLEVEESRLDEVREIVVEEMLGAARRELRVRMEVKYKVGPSWGQLE